MYECRHSLTMIIVKKARSVDFEKIYPLLLEFNNPYLTKEDWKQLFVNHCGTDEDYFGYALFDQDKVMGFLGLIFSHRLIDGRMRKFCNMTSYIIRTEYQGKGLSRLLLAEVVKLKEYTITTLPPPLKTLRMHINQGFQELDSGYRLIFPVPTIRGFFDTCSLLSGVENLKNNLNSDELKIYKDHSLCKCIHLLITKNKERCYIIVKRILRKGLPFIEIHYLSNLPMFIKYINQIRIKLSLYLRVWGLLMDERLLKSQKIKYSIIRKYHRPKLFRSSLLQRDNITDNLYTESLILNV